jgi:O-antigen/teichoic acid export membrane protein
MMRRLFENTVVSAGAFLLISMLGLLIVPIIVRTWGLAEFGLIALARALLPVGAMAVLDLGVSEITTQAVARARVNSDWRAANRRISCTVLMACVVGMVVAISFTVTAPFLVSFFRVSDNHAEAFRGILYATALANLILFPSLVAEGVLKGFERFPMLRALDVGSAVAYVLATVVAAYYTLPFETVALVFLGSLALRAMVVIFMAFRLAKQQIVSPRFSLDVEMARDTSSWAWTMAQSKLIGGLQGPLLPLIVGALLGPRAVGLFDILMRLPRFCKSALSILNTAVLPVSASIEERGADLQMRRLGQAGLVIVPALTVPMLAWAAVFSEPILRLWIGPSVSDQWPWMALAFAVPIVSQYLSFGQVVMLVRQSSLALLNRLALLQTLLMGVVMLFSFRLLEERAFILALAVSYTLVLPLQLFVICRQLEVPGLIIARVLLIQGFLMVPLGLTMLFFGAGIAVDNLWQLGISVAVWCSLVWALEYMLLLNRSSRHEVRLMTLGLFGLLGFKGSARPRS